MMLHLTYFKIYVRILKTRHRINRIKRFYSFQLKWINKMKKLLYFIQDKVNNFMNFKVTKTTSELL